VIYWSLYTSKFWVHTSTKSLIVVHNYCLDTFDLLDAYIHKLWGFQGILYIRQIAYGHDLTLQIFNPYLLTFRSIWRPTKNGFCSIEKPHKIVSKPHGNSKSVVPFIHTTPSTLGKLKESCKRKSPKELVNNITKEKFRNLVLLVIFHTITSKYTSDNDDLLSVIVMCKESQRKDSDPFVCIVKSVPEPMSVLCTNAQLYDMQQFCTDSMNLCPISDKFLLQGHSR